MLNDLRIFNPFKVNGLKRLGNKHDGGYVIHAPSLKNVDILITYGVGYNVEFEKDFHSFTGCPVLAFDPTMKDLNVFIRKIKDGRLLSAVKQLRWLLKWLCIERGLDKFQIKFIEEGIAVKDAVDYKSLDTHFIEYHLQNKNVLLKVDIDGGEYELFTDKNFCKNLSNIIQILIEFHDLDRNLVQAEKILKSLSATHTLIHIHGNNYGPPFIYDGKEIPKVIEVSLLRNDFLEQMTLSTDNYPIKDLDSPCDSSKEDICLNFFK